jgi:hypothetical protein
LPGRKGISCGRAEKRVKKKQAAAAAGGGRRDLVKIIFET